MILRGLEPDGTGNGRASELTRALDHLLVPLDDLSSAVPVDSSAVAVDGRATEGGGLGGSELDQVSWEPQKLVARGENVYVAIRLRASQAQAGARPVIRFTVTEMCSHCGGNGRRRAYDPKCETCAGTGRLRERLHGETGPVLPSENCPRCGGGLCANCGGTGGVQAERRFRLLLPPLLEDGSQLRVAGEGSVPRGVGVPGDLFVDVHVLSRPKGFRVTRYLSLALFLLALALLAYVLLKP
jgi:DnaJ-class molecular chaperone